MVSLDTSRILLVQPPQSPAIGRGARIYSLRRQPLATTNLKSSCHLEEPGFYKKRHKDMCLTAVIDLTLFDAITDRKALFSIISFTLAEKVQIVNVR